MSDKLQALIEDGNAENVGQDIDIVQI